MPNIPAPKSGYAYVYVSNESDEHVYFDNVQINHTRGRITEENHYYAYGLKIAGISSKKLADLNEGQVKNNYLYNDKELWDEGDLNWYDYGFRNYDPQIGRFTQLDPLTNDYPEHTPYQYASCDPITNIDIDGLEGGLSTLAKPLNLETVIVKAVAKHAAPAAAKLSLSTGLSLTGKAIGGAIIKGLDWLGKAATQTAVFAASALNSVATNNVGGIGRYHPKTTAGNYGAAFGDAFSLAQGAVEAGGGALLTLGGGVSAVIPGLGEVTAPVGIGIGLAGMAHGGMVVIPTAYKNLMKFEPVNEKPVHGNSDSSPKETTIYKKYDKNGKFEKNGITSQQPIEKRYTKGEMDGGYLESVEKGQRRIMRKKERVMTETNPGPKNKEPWAGKRKK